MAMYQTIVYSQWNGEGSNLTWDAGLELFWLLGGECSGLAAWSQHSISFSLTTSANISKFIPYAPKSETLYFSRKKKKKAHSRSACKDENNIWREEKRLWAGKVAWICESLDYAFLFILVLVWSCGRLTWEVSHNHQHQRNYDVPQHCPVREIHSNEV